MSRFGSTRQCHGQLAKAAEQCCSQHVTVVWYGAGVTKYNEAVTHRKELHRRAKIQSKLFETPKSYDRHLAGHLVLHAGLEILYQQMCLAAMG